MSLRKALLMVAVLFALGAYVYFVEFAQEKAETAQKKLLTFDAETVTDLTLTYPDRAVHLKKDAAEKWQITQPLEVEADETTVSNLLNAIANAEVNRTLDETSQDGSLYGLNAPVVKFQLTLKDGKPLPVISLGKDTPVGFSVYAQREGEAKILLVPQALRLGTQKEVKDLRDRTVLAFTNEEVKKIAVHGPDQEILLSKADSGWNIEKPLEVKADDTEVLTFLSALRNIKAQDFIEQPTQDLKDLGLAPPQLTVSLVLGGDNAQKTVLIGGEKSSSEKGDKPGPKQRYVKRGERDTIFVVGDWVLRDLSKNANDFRDKMVIRFAPEQAAKIEAQRQDGNGFTLTRGADKKWTIDKTQEGTLKEATLGQFVNDLHEVRGFEIVADNPSDLSAYGLQAPMATLTVYDDAGAKLAAVSIAQKTEGDNQKSFVLAEGGKTVFALRDYVFDRLNKKPADFWEKPGEKKETAPTPAAPEESTEHDEAEEGE
ncbi:MAG: DUF4340 domain-containing protein [Deltaproteobacteria bacterium]|nr:DUF4340 domain-containing protein [Deltaproteobacteria bacterium]